MRNTNENEEAYIATITDILLEAVELRADLDRESLDELHQLFTYHIRESYLIGRVAKGLEMQDTLSEVLVELK